MAGLACRKVSPAAWNILDWLASGYITIPDELATEAMKLLASIHHAVPIVSGESGAGGMAVLIAAANDPALRTSLGMEDRSTVVFVRRRRSHRP